MVDLQKKYLCGNVVSTGTNHLKAYLNPERRSEGITRKSSEGSEEIAKRASESKVLPGHQRMETGMMDGMMDKRKVESFYNKQLHKKETGIMMRKNQVAGIAAGVLSAVLLAGCGSNGGNNASVDTPKSSEAASTVAESSAEATTEEAKESMEQADTGEITYPVSTDESLSIWSGNGDVKPASVYKDYTESPFHTGLEEMTGIHMEWNFVAEGSDANQAYNLLLTEDELPDIIFKYGTQNSNIQKLVDDGVIYDLTDYLPKYAPDYWRVIHQPEYASVLRDITSDDGRIYQVATFVESDYNITYTGPAIRKDWLDECGLEEPVTLDDWDNVLRTFKEKYNATLAWADGRFFPGIACGTGAYGSIKAAQYVDDNGRIQLAQVQPEWKEYMTILNKWYEEGLIDKDITAMDDAAIRTKALNNEIGVCVTGMSQITCFTEDAQEEGTGAVWEGIEYPRTAPGEPTCIIQSRASQYPGCGCIITTSCPEDKLPLALAWLNYGYTEEGRLYWNFGKEGETYTLDSDGTPKFTSLITEDPDGLSMATQKYCGVSTNGISIQAAQFVYQRNVVNAAEAVYKWIDNTTAPKHCLPALSMTEEENAKWADKINAINTRVEEMAVKFLVGDESLDNFDAYVEEINGMGLQECLDIEQAALDRYMAKKVK